MGQKPTSGDQLYLTAESLSQDFSLFPRKERTAFLQGILDERQIEIELELLKNLDVDSYIEATIQPVEESSRPGSRAIIKALGEEIVMEIDNGPFYAVELMMDFQGTRRAVGFITQDRAHNNGVWLPEHHEAAALAVSEFAIRSLPIVTFMDTPGADAGEAANKANQAHTISRLIAELCNVDVPTVGVIIGQGYSGGAIPLAASNILLSLRKGVFNTIQPKGLASLVQRYNLSWQECAKFVGVSPYELYKQGNIDGIVDYEPGEGDKLENLRNVIISSILSIEESAKDFVANHPEILDHYQRNIARYLNLSKSLEAVHASSTLKLRVSPTEYPNVFGVAYRHLRYLGLRKRIRSTTTTRYGRLSVQEIPHGQLAERADRERRAAFLSWLQDPDKVLYEDSLNKSWQNYQEKKLAMGEERGRIAQLIFGEPEKNYQDAKSDLCLCYGLHLYNRWKGGAHDNFTALVDYLRDHEDTHYLLEQSDIKDQGGLLQALKEAETPFVRHMKEQFSYEGKKLFDANFVAQKSEAFVSNKLLSELNLILGDPSLHDDSTIVDQNISGHTRELLEKAKAGNPSIQMNRRLLEEYLWSYIGQKSAFDSETPTGETTVLDVVLDEDIRDQFIETCKNLVVFGTVYNELIDNLVVVARQAHETKILQKEFIQQLVDGAVHKAFDAHIFEQEQESRILKGFADWLENFVAYARSDWFLKSVEEWKRIIYPSMSDTLFVIVSFFFEKLLPEYYNSERNGKVYEGRVNPVRIGRRKDFWNRLTIAYRDLLFQEILTEEKSKRNTTPKAFVDRYLTEFEEHNNTLMTADPVAFPTLRPAIESALAKEITPCGIITGIGTFNAGKEKNGHRIGVVITNLEFQAGCIDMAGCEKICKLLVECSVQRLPVVCFISSGGMQTKEGASVLFSMPVLNDRITRFIRDYDLPIIMFGFGDCTGGAQASFVTHPLVQTYYCSGTTMGFAGRQVVESNLPSTSTLSNYLSLTTGAMRGLVQHPFAEKLDDQLRKVDPDIPLPTETVVEVVERIMQGAFRPLSPQNKKKKPVESDLVKPIIKTLIHARGCTAVKLVRKAQEMGVQIVLVQSDPDMDSVAVDMVTANGKDKVICIGGNTSDESYLNALSVLRIAEDEKVDSLHPGIGFLSEDPNFARLCRDHKINFIGPKVTSMETMGNKSNAISTTMGIGVPVVPGSHGIITSSEGAAEIADQVGYPVMIKAVHGGGGKGIQVVEKPEEMHSLFHQVTTEARNAFGNGDIYIEKFITSLRHIEVQILRDTHGTTKILGLRDCSVQRHNQKLMEESGSTVLPDELKQAVFSHAREIASAVDYTGAGTVEFIYDVPSKSVYFMEMNTRLQVEHPVTEVVSGVDIVKAQFDIACGNSIDDLKVSENGYALEVRVNAEKVELAVDGTISFKPMPGEITECILPEEPHIQLISSIAKDSSVSPFYDSMIVQIICWGTERIDAINRMRAYLDKVVINGICTNISLIKRILADEEYINGAYDTEFLPQFISRTDAGELIKEISEASGTVDKGVDIASLQIEGSSELKVVSPSTGLFYITPSPSEPEYVSVGDVIDTGQRICLLEAMKIFSAITLQSFVSDGVEIYPADQKYEVTRINHPNGQQVNEGDLLFVIKPVE
jgi:acetyl/propionyl-CoA carboxylase alpha subunit/acetyl-CoA carboxylase beta subunit